MNVSVKHRPKLESLGQGKGGIHIEKWSSPNWDNDNEDTFVIAYCGAFGICHPNGDVTPAEYDFCDLFPRCEEDPRICFDCKEAIEDDADLPSS
jgi:hypothetical protein